MSVVATGVQEQAMNLKKVAYEIQEFTNDTLGHLRNFTIPRNGDTFLPLGFLLSIDEDAVTEEVVARIDDISLEIGGQSIVRIPGKLFTALSKIQRDENQIILEYDWSMFVKEIYMVSLAFHEVRIKLRLSSTHQIQEATVLGRYTHLDYAARHQMAAAQHNLPIQQLSWSSVDPPSTTSSYALKLNFDLLSKGYFIEANLQQLQSCEMRLNGHTYFTYSRAVLRTVGKQITPTLLWLPFNPQADFRDTSFQSYAGSLNQSRIDNVHMRLSFSSPQPSLTIYSLSSNILKIISGMGGTAFAEGGGSISLIQWNPTVVPHAVAPAQNWFSAICTRPVDSDRTMCPIEYEEIGAGAHYGHCATCRHNFLETPLRQCLRQRPNCPMCRTAWSDWTIYTNAEPEAAPVAT
jgi:hypothetical protein